MLPDPVCLVNLAGFAVLTLQPAACYARRTYTEEKMPRSWTQKLSRLGLTAALLVPLWAQAGGFELPGIGARSLARGGAFGVLADDLTAIGINPAGLIRNKGTRLLLDYSMKWQHVTYTANEFSGQSAPDSFLEPSENQSPFFGLGAELVLASDFGLDDWAFAIGVYGPNAVGNGDYGTEGGNRYMLNDMDVVLLYYTLTVAYGWEDTFGVGVSLQYAHAPQADLSLVVDGTALSKVNPYNSPNFDLLANLKLKDNFAVTAIAGAWWRVIPELEVALSARVVPVSLDLKGDLKLEGVEGGVDISKVSQQNTSVALDLDLPVWVRAGLRYRHLKGDREVFDIELNVQWENWTVFKEYAVDLQGTVNIDGLESKLTSLNIPRAWRDTVSVRLGGTYNAVEDLLWVSLGGFYETAAVPEGYEHLDFLSFARFGVGTGVRFTIAGFDLTVAYMHVFQETRTNDERSAKIQQQRPLAPCPDSCEGFEAAPANNGKFESSFDVLNVSLQFNFDEF
ncbi:MAG: long-subunit fatty acid transport protein [Myxococcota bacterium]|jgi:long-subunit fatty acid transport protein